MSLQFQTIANLVGPQGISAQSGAGAPTQAIGSVGDIYFDTTNARLYGKKTASGWPTTFVSLVGPATQATLPNDITGNSISLAPVAGDSNAVAITLGNGTTTLFKVDAAGNTSVGGTLKVTGATTLAALTVTTLTNTGLGIAAGLQSSLAGTAAAPAYAYTAQTDTGVYLATTSTTAASLGMAVNGTQALGLSKTGATVPGTLNVSGQTSLGPLSATTSAISSNETVGGTLNVAGLATVAGNVSTPVVTTTQTQVFKTVGSTNYVVPNLSLPGSFGDGNAYPPSGLSTDALGNLALNYMGVPVLKMANTGYNSNVGNTPSSSFPTNFLSGSYNFNVGGTPQLAIGSTAVKFGYTSNTIPVTMQSFSGNILQLQNGGSSPAFTTTTVGTVDTSGNATFAGIMKAASVTFGDGTSQTTAYTSTLANNQSKWIATSNGTAAAPAFTYTSNTDTGEYLKTASTTAAVLGLSVNATDAMTLSKTGVAVPGTLTVTGTTAASAISASGLVTGANFTLSSGGKITFADGTTQTTAAAASAAGSSATFSATSNGSVTAPNFTWSNQTDTGMYLGAQSTTAAGLALAVNGTQAAYFSKTTATLNAVTLTSLSASGAITANNGISVPTGNITTNNNVLASGYVQAGQGSVSAPSLRSSLEANTGLFFPGGPSSVNTTVTGTLVTQVQSGGLTVTGYMVASTGVYGTQLVSSAQGTAGAPNFSSSQASGYGLYVNTSTPATGLSVAGTSILSGTSAALTLPLPTTATKTLTSTVTAGTAAFVTPNGFRHRIDLGHLYVTSSTTSPVQTYRVIGTAGAGNLFTANVSEIQPVAGSVTSLHVNTTGNTSGTTTATTVQVYKNGVAISGATLSLAANKPSDTALFAKGTYTFTANDTLQAYVTYGTAGANISTNVSINVEVLA